MSALSLNARVTYPLTFLRDPQRPYLISFKHISPYGNTERPDIYVNTASRLWAEQPGNRAMIFTEGTDFSFLLTSRCDNIQTTLK
jgi:hypothetical protein